MTEAKSPTIVPPMGDEPMPSIENAPPALFRPGRDITTADVWEITLMFLIEMTHSRVTFDPGALRNVPLSPERVAQLSDSARRFMVPAEYVPAARPAAPGAQTSAA